MDHFPSLSPARKLPLRFLLFCPPLMAQDTPTGVRIVLFLAPFPK
jgi:hypothetical protein